MIDATDRLETLARALAAGEADQCFQESAAWSGQEEDRQWYRDLAAKALAALEPMTSEDMRDKLEEFAPVEIRGIVINADLNEVRWIAEWRWVRASGRTPSEAVKALHDTIPADKLVKFS